MRKTLLPKLQHLAATAVQGGAFRDDPYLQHPCLCQPPGPCPAAQAVNCVNGALALITLFVTHYNFLRPHMSLNYQTPVAFPELQGIATIQGKWTKILSLAV